MLLEINNVLGFSQNTINECPRNILVSQTGSVDCSFVLHHFISLYLKAEANVCIVAAQQTFAHYNNVAQKLGVNLANARDKGDLMYIDLMGAIKDYMLSTADPNGLIAPILERGLIAPILKRNSMKEFGKHIKEQVESVSTNGRPTLLLVDSVGTLVTLGVSVPQVSAFVRYIERAVTEGAVVVGLDHDVEDEDADVLYKDLRHQAALHVNVAALQSGYSKDVHGQVTFERRDPSGAADDTCGERTLQYKLSDKSVELFARGTSIAVL